MKRVIDLPDELAQRLNIYLQHPEKPFFSLVKKVLEKQNQNLKCDRNLKEKARALVC
ncbi:hypothetical protein NIES4102_24260 [Chondrocystis sp. NIES-4102]|nr:hypothetical protein NIES4102_24260 [Chondrocystis sp. NIES-4102]